MKSNGGKSQSREEKKKEDQRKERAKRRLVGGLEHFLFFHILGMSSSQLTQTYFSEGWLYHQLEDAGANTRSPNDLQLRKVGKSRLQRLQQQQLQLQLGLHSFNYTNFATITSTLRHTQAYCIPQLWVRWPLQPLQPLQKTQLQPFFCPSVDAS